jgi:hypothetical protein
MQKTDLNGRRREAEGRNANWVFSFFSAETQILKNSEFGGQENKNQTRGVRIEY